MPAMLTPDLDTPIAIPLQPEVTTAVTQAQAAVGPTETPTFVVIPVTATQPPAPTDTAVVATLPPPPVLPTATPSPLTTPTSNVYALPTLPTQTVVDAATVVAAAPAVSATNTPITLAPIPVVSQRPVWVDRLGAIAVLGAILVVIGFIAFAVARMFSVRRRE